MSDSFNNWHDEQILGSDTFGYIEPDPLTVRAEDDEILMYHNTNYQDTEGSKTDNKVKNILIYSLIIAVVVLLVVIVVLFSGHNDNDSKTDKKDKISHSVNNKVISPTKDKSDKEDGTEPGVAEEYKYNTEILVNENVPVAGDPVISSIKGYTEVTDQSFLSLPFSVSKDGEKVYEIISIGKCSGEFYDGNNKRTLNEALAIVVKNTTEKVVSYSNISFVYDDGKNCTFTVTNLTPGKSALVFAEGIVESTEENTPPITVGVPFADVKKINVSASQVVMATSLPRLEDKIGVDYKDGKFIITNLTSEYFGQVAVKFMQCADNDANVFIGGNTGVVYQDNVKPYETYLVEVEYFDHDKSTIIAVETYKVD